MEKHGGKMYTTIKGMYPYNSQYTNMKWKVVHFDKRHRVLSSNYKKLALKEGVLQCHSQAVRNNNLMKKS